MPARIFSCGIPAVVLFALCTAPAQSRQAAPLAALRGTVRDPEGKPVSAATVYLQAKDSAQHLTAHSDAQGIYNFSALRAGVYALRAEMAGYDDAAIPSLFLGPHETKTVDLSLGPALGLANAAASQSASPAAPQFFDPPQFTVAGVTDTTSLGGHGSDTIVRARETIAKETVSLGKAPEASQPAASAGTEKLLREKVEREPGSFEANHRLGEALLANGKARKAIPYLEHAAELAPGNYENSYDLARANADAGDDGRARDLVRALLPHHDTAELHHLLADVQERLSDSLDAVHEYQRAAELDPQEPYLFDWGAELLLHHAPEPALDVFSRSSRLFPRSVRLLIGVGSAWFARGSYDEAVRPICQASDLDPDNPIPYIFLGKMQQAKTAPSPDVVERLRRFVTLQPHSAQANYYYAVSLWRSRKNPEDVGTAQIESRLNNAIRLDPKFGAAYLQLGMLHAEQRNLPKAISDYQLAIDASPQMEEAHYRLAQVYRQTGEVEKARAELEVYDRMAKESAEQTERSRHEIRQFVYTLRDRSAPQEP